MSELFANLAVPLFIGGVVIYGLAKKTDVYASFVKGAKGGLKTAFSILPYLVAMLFAIDIFAAAGGFELLSKAFSPIVGLIGVPSELLPLALMRPFSGGASLGLLAGVFSAYGPDSYLGRVAATFMGSTETLFYTTSLYFGSVGVKRLRYAVAVGIVCDTLGLILACLICRVIGP